MFFAEFTPVEFVKLDTFHRDSFGGEDHKITPGTITDPHLSLHLGVVFMVSF